jgi:predicted transcriptional regulator
MVRKSSWSLAEQRRLIEMARGSKSLEEAAEATGRKPASIKKMALRLGISFRPNVKKDKGPVRG